MTGKTAPKVSVIMPAYNAEKSIETSLRSAMNQTYENLEIIVIDDCSQDTTAEVVERFAREDLRIRLFRNDTNMGVARSRNRGMDICTGEYVAFLDSDDIWYADKTEKQISRLEETGGDICYTSYKIIYIEKENAEKEYRVPATVSLNGMLRQNLIGCSTVMLTKQMVRQYRFRPGYYHEDYVMWVEMLRDGHIAAGVQEVLTNYSYYSSSRSGNKLAASRHRWEIYRDLMGFSILKSAYYFVQYAFAGIVKYWK